MKNIIIIIAFATLLIYSCKKDDNELVIFDHAAQALIDDAILIQFLKNHYFDTAVDSVKTLVSGETPLYTDDKLITMNSITENDINYTLYSYVKNEGTPTIDKGKPTVMDSVLVKYQGHRIINTDSVSGTSFDNNNGVWFTLNQVIRGWTYSLTNFKGGNNITNNGPITYENGGKGVLFIPSGLAYANLGSTGIFSNECLLFYVDLYDIVKDTDHDNDGVASILEDPNDNNDPRDDDTDQDSIANYLDTDDDGDGTLTKNEDANKDGDPRNDFSDTSNPTLPDYLNPNI